MRENSTQIRQEVQTFIIATEQLYKFIAEGKSLTAHEVEAVSCCMHELLAKGSGDEATVRAFRAFGDRLVAGMEMNRPGSSGRWRS